MVDDDWGHWRMRGYRCSPLLECIGKLVQRENVYQTARRKASSGKTRNVEVVFSVIVSGYMNWIQAKWRVCRINAEDSVWWRPPSLYRGLGNSVVDGWVYPCGRKSLNLLNGTQHFRYSPWHIIHCPTFVEQQSQYLFINTNVWPCVIGLSRRQHA